MVIAYMADFPRLGQSSRRTWTTRKLSRNRRSVFSLHGILSMSCFNSLSAFGTLTLLCDPIRSLGHVSVPAKARTQVSRAVCQVV